MSTLKRERVTINFDDGGNHSVLIQWKDNLGRGFSAAYPTPIPTYPPGHTGPVNTVTGAQMVNSLFNGNHTVNSATKKLYQQLQGDGYINAGTIGGTPD